MSSAASFRWRRFDFFVEAALGADAADAAAASEALRAIRVTCVAGSGAPSGGRLAIGAADGRVHLLGAELRALAFVAHADGVSQVQQLQAGALLATLGHDRESAPCRASLKLWRADGARGSAPSCARILKLFPSGAPEPEPTAMRVSECLGCAAVGLRTGGLLLARCSDLVRDRFAKLRPLDAPPPPAREREPAGGGGARAEEEEEAGADGVVELFFSGRAHVADDEGGGADGGVHVAPPCGRAGGGGLGLFVVGSRTVGALTGLGTRHEARATLDSVGCAPGCAALAPSGLLLVGRLEAVYVYALAERGVAFAFGGAKLRVACVGGYLAVLATPPTLHAPQPRQPQPPEGEEGAAPAARGAAAARPPVLTLYDLRHKLIAAQLPVPGARAECARVAREWGCALVLGALQPPLRALRERPLSELLAELVSRGHHEAALALASARGLPRAQLAALHGAYADALDGRGEHEAAAPHHAAAIPHVPPARVVRRYVDSSHAPYLARYLEALHAAAHAPPPAAADGAPCARVALSAEHTQLLLACYLQADRRADAAALVGTDGGRCAPGGASARGFDVRGALALCVRAGLVEAALELSKRHGLHAEHVGLLLHACEPPRADAAIAHVGTLGWAAARGALLAHGRALLLERPPRLVGALMHHLARAEAEGQGLADLPAFVALFGGRPHWLRVLLEYVSSTHLQPACSPAANHAAANHAGAGAAPAAHGGGAGADSGGVGVSSVSSLVYETLLELYLTPAEAQPAAGGGAPGGGGACEPSECAPKALALLQAAWGRYDSTRALALCHQRGFTPGAVCVLERRREYGAILALHAAHAEHAQLLHACRRHGEQQPALWARALSHFARAHAQLGAAARPSAAGSAEAAEAEGASDGEASDGAPPDEEGALLDGLGEALAQVDARALLPPLLVLQELSASPTLPLGLARDYLLHHLRALTEAASDEAAHAAALAREAERSRAELRELAAGARVFQAARCAKSGAPLEPPTVHFLCMHSFNRSALPEPGADGADACPLCAPEHARVLERQRALAARAAQHDAFFKQLEGSTDGFATVSDYFGRSVMTPPLPPR